MVMETGDALLEDESDAVDASDETPEQEVEEVDPRDARLATIEAELGRLRSLDPSKIGPAIGRVSALQSELAALRDRDPAAEIDPRLAANETLTISLAQALASSDIIDDRFKESLNAALRGIEQARSERDRARLEATLEDRIAKRLTPPPVAGVDETPWEEATVPVIELATQLGVDVNSVPWQAIREAAGTPAKAVALATKWLYENNDPTVQRVAARQKVVANGTPARNSSGPTISDMSDADAAYATGDINLDQYRNYRKQFGVSLEPGGGR